MKNAMPTADQITLDWSNNPRWKGVKRNYSAEDVVRLRGTAAAIPDGLVRTRRSSVRGQ